MSRLIFKCWVIVILISVFCCSPLNKIESVDINNVTLARGVYRNYGVPNNLNIQSAELKLSRKELKQLTQGNLLTYPQMIIESHSEGNVSSGNLETIYSPNTSLSLDTLIIKFKKKRRLVTNFRISNTSIRNLTFIRDPVDSNSVSFKSGFKRDSARAKRKIDSVVDLLDAIERAHDDYSKNMSSVANPYVSEYVNSFKQTLDEIWEDYEEAIESGSKKVITILIRKVDQFKFDLNQFKKVFSDEVVVSVSDTLLFSSGSYKITNGHSTILNEYVSSIKINLDPNKDVRLHLTVYGFADEEQILKKNIIDDLCEVHEYPIENLSRLNPREKSEILNQFLSQSRANTVADYINNELNRQRPDLMKNVDVNKRPIGMGFTLPNDNVKCENPPKCPERRVVIISDFVFNHFLDYRK